MAGTYDGSLIFDTKIDSEGFSKGTNTLKKQANGMKSVFASLGRTIAIAFSAVQIIKFAKDSIQATTELENAMIGLQSIMEGQGRSFSDAKAFINDYISDGLVPATNAITAYKNLALRGYDDSQIKQVMVALKDSAAFGRQASYTLGQAVQTATEGLKNENSILVDNAGVTKNVAKMWDDYAKSIGTTASNLTKQQKIQAEVSGIMEETKFQTGDAAKIANTYSGQILKLSFNFNNLKIAVGNFVRPIVTVLIPVLNTAIQSITKFINSLASISQALFGSQQTSIAQAEATETAIGGAVDNQEALTDETKKTAKANEKTLASFDEIQKITQQNSNGNAGSMENTTSYSSGGNENQINELDGKISPLLDTLEKFKYISFDSLIQSLDKLKRSFEPFSGTIFDGLKWSIDNVIYPLTKWTVEEALPRFFDTLATAIEIGGTILDQYIETYKDFYNNFLKPIASFVADKFLEFWDEFNIKFKEISDIIQNSTAFEDLRLILNKIYEVLGPIVEDWIGFHMELSKLFLTNAMIELKYWFIDMEDKIGLVASLLRGDFSSAWEHLKDLMVDNKIDKAKEKFDELKKKITEVADNIKEKFSKENLDTMFSNLGISIGTAVSNMTTAWNDKIVPWFENDVKPWFTKEKWLSIFDGIKTGMSEIMTEVMKWFTKEKWEEASKNLYNGLVANINKAIQGLEDLANTVIGFFNKIIDGYNAVAEKNPLMSEINPISRANFSEYKIPALATGTVVPANYGNFLAMLGDNKREPEIVAPESAIKQAVLEAMAEGGGSNKSITVILEMDRREFGRAVYKANKKETQRVGLSLGGAY